MTQKLSITQIDYSGEKTTTGFYLVDVAVDGTNWADILTDRTNLLAGIAAVTFDNVSEHTLSTSVRLTNQPDSDENAQRERKLLIAYEDNVTLKQYTVSIGCADVSKFVVVAGSDLVDMATGGGSTLKTAIEGNALSEVGNAISVVQMRLVGRNT